MKEITVARNTPVWVLHPSQGALSTIPEIGEVTWLPTWQDLTGDLRQFETKADLARQNAGRFRDKQMAGRLWKLAYEVRPGHLVAVPAIGEGSAILIGRVHEAYSFRDDPSPYLRHGITIEWRRNDLDSFTFESDLRSRLRPEKKFLFRADPADAIRIIRALEHGVDPGRSGSSRQALYRFLIAAAEQADLNPRAVSIRDLLSFWGHERRTSAVLAEVDRDLTRSGLTTDPPFSQGVLDDRVRLIPIKRAPQSEPHGSGQVAATGTSAGPETLTLLVGAFARQTSPISIDTTIEEAMTLMVKLNCSQLAVVDSESNYLGAVTSDRLMESILVRAPLSLRQAMDEQAPCAYRQDHLLGRIHLIHNHGFVFVHSSDRKSIDGIITATDLTKIFETFLRPIMKLEEIERRLRKAVDGKLSPAEISQHARYGNGVASASDLTLGEYGALLGVEKYWNRLGWNTHRHTVIESLKEVTEIRNSIMHFSTDPVSTEQDEALEGLLRILRGVQRHL